MTRPRIRERMTVGIRAIDGLLPLGRGQRVGLFAGSGVGKSSLLGQIARQADADVFVVCLVGERGREVREFLDDTLGENLRDRGVVVCATSDAPALLRMKAALAATTLAEGFRDQGKRVLLLVDSITRFARAAREVGLAAGEPPTRRGFPPSVFAALPELLERAGTSEHGSITALYTVLVEGDDLDEPIADEVRGIVDGHLVLSRSRAGRGLFPAIDITQSISRLAPHLADTNDLDAAQVIRAWLTLLEEKHDLLSLGAYKAGTDPKLDRALAKANAIEAFLVQDQKTSSPLSETLAALAQLAQPASP